MASKINRKRSRDDKQIGLRSSKRRRLGSYVKPGDDLELLVTGKWSDFKMQCQDQVFNVHRAVLWGQSPFIDAAMDGDYQEASEQKLDLSAEEPSTVDVLLRYMYTGEFTDALDSTLIDDDELIKYSALVKLHRLADFLLMKDLKRSVFDEVHRCMEEILVTNETDLDVVQDAIEAIALRTYGSKPALFEVRTHLAFLLGGMHRGHMEGWARVEGEFLQSLVEQYPEMGWELYKYAARQINMHVADLEGGFKAFIERHENRF